MCENSEVFVASTLQITGIKMNNNILFYCTDILNNWLRSFFI